MCQKFDTEQELKEFKESEKDAIIILAEVVTSEGIWIRYAFKA